jgi:hypothetical protein
LQIKDGAGRFDWVTDRLGAGREALVEEFLIFEDEPL